MPLILAFLFLNKANLSNALKTVNNHTNPYNIEKNFNTPFYYPDQKMPAQEEINQYYYLQINSLILFLMRARKILLNFLSSSLKHSMIYKTNSRSFKIFKNSEITKK